MSDRGEVKRLILDAYQARIGSDLAAMGEIFASEIRFKLAGSPSASAVAVSVSGIQDFQNVMKGMIKTFDWVDQTILSMVVEGPKAAVHWRGSLRSTVTGETVETEMIDLFEVRDGKIQSLIEFCDTPHAARMNSARPR
jgi:ketosteroid isomerase-like protein